MPCGLDGDFPHFRRSRPARASRLCAGSARQGIVTASVPAGPRVATSAIDKLTACGIEGKAPCYNADPFRLLTWTDVWTERA